MKEKQDGLHLVKGDGLEHQQKMEREIKKVMNVLQGVKIGGGSQPNKAVIKKSQKGMDDMKETGYGVNSS
jgi:hypothetical protein